MRRSAWERADSLALGNRVGTGTLERALAHERRAVAVDPGYPPSALTLAALALGLRDTALYAAARDALRGPTRRSVAAAELLLARGRLERATDQSDSARQVFARAAARGAASDPRARAEPVSLARLELARTQLALGSRDGETAASMAQPPTTPRWSRRTVRISHPSRTTPTSPVCLRRKRRGPLGVPAPILDRPRPRRAPAGGGADPRALPTPAVRPPPFRAH